MTTAHHLGSHQRRLWRDDDSIDGDDNIVNECNDHVESIEELQRHYSSRPPLRSFLSLCQSTLVVGQEFVLVAYFLARHQQTRRDNENDYGENRDEDDLKQLVSHLFVLLALFLILLFNDNTDGVERKSNIHIRDSTTTTTTYKEAFNVPQQQQQHPRRIKIKQRSMDALLLALLLRLLASVLRTLTESYSSDTVHALANAGWMLHLLTCDYAYANGMEHDQDVSSTITTTHGSATLQKRPAFLGGTVSLNAAFFSTTLLASRLSSNSKVYFFVSLSVVLFAFNPAARHGVSQHKYGHLVHCMVLACLLFATLVLLTSSLEAYVLVSVLGTVCIVAPAWKYYLQRHKQIISGPWDVAKLQAITELPIEDDDEKTKKKVN